MCQVPYAVKQGCVRLRNALKCVDMHLGGHCYNRVEPRTSRGAEKTTVASAADCEVEADSLTARHERHKAVCHAAQCDLHFAAAVAIRCYL